MDELTPEEMRGAATAANLRRAFGSPVRDDLPPAFAALLARLAALPQGGAGARAAGPDGSGHGHAHGRRAGERMNRTGDVAEGRRGPGGSSRMPA